MKRRMIRIPVPIATEGQSCLVLNYRKKPPVWEEALVDSAPVWRDGNFGGWSYTVRLDRRSVIDRLIRVRVGDSSIRREE